MPINIFIIAFFIGAAVGTLTGSGIIGSLLIGWGALTTYTIFHAYRSGILYSTFGSGSQISAIDQKEEPLKWLYGLFMHLIFSLLMFYVGHIEPWLHR